MKLILILLFLVLAVHAQQERVAILNTVDDFEPSISISDLLYLTNRLRETAVKVLPKQKFGVMTTESIVAFFGSQENAIRVCNESSCLAEVGRKVNAEYVAQARIGRFGDQLSINFQLYNSKSGNLMDSFTGSSKDVFGLLAIVDEMAPVLFRQMLEESSSPPPKLEIAEPEPKLELKPEPEPEFYVSKPEVEKPIKTSIWVAIGLDVLGTALIAYGISENANMINYRREYRQSGLSQSEYNDAWAEADKHRSSRNMLYVLGGLVLASGIGVHIWF